MKDFLTEIKYVGLTSRLKRLSDALLYSTKDLYTTMDLDIEPNWNLVFRLLQKNKEMTITQIAESLRFSHPAVVKIIKKMKKNGYVESRSDRTDKRKQILALTIKARQNRKHLETYWNAGAEVIRDILKDSPNFLEELLEIEKNIYQLDYKERTLQKLNTQ